MNKPSRQALIASAIVYGATATVAHPADPDGTGFYVGAGGGASVVKIDDSGINDSLRSLGFTSATTSKDESGTAYKVFAGYAINRYVAIEGGYFDLGKFGFKSLVLPPGSLSVDVKVRGVNLDAVLSYPFAEGFSVFGRVGLQSAETKGRLAGSGSVLALQPETKETKTGWKAGLGIGYEFSNGLGLRGEWERYNVADGTKTDTKADVDVFGISLFYRF